MYYDNKFLVNMLLICLLKQAAVLWSLLLTDFQTSSRETSLTSFSFFPKTYYFKIILSTQVVKTDLQLWGLHKL